MYAILWDHMAKESRQYIVFYSMEIKMNLKLEAAARTDTSL